MIVVDKYHGLGNDFLVVIDPETGPGADTARRLCDRHRGIGADGLIVGRSAASATDLGGARLRFQLFNADGSEAEMSGNGMRCLAQAALDAGLVTAGEDFEVDTPAGVRQVRIHPRPPGVSAAAADGAEIWATVGMGRAGIVGPGSRCNVGHGQLLVDMGNPHLVIAGPDPAGVDVAGLGPVLERSEVGGLNVEFVTLGPGPDELTMRVWERGVGETEACGTGSCAAAVAFHHWGRVGTAVTVHQPGGAVAVGLDPDGTVRLSGPSQRVARCIPADGGGGR
jgi:diaminopimelate epimerase